MSERFYDTDAADGYGGLIVDVGRLFREHPVDRKDAAAPGISSGPGGIYRRAPIPLRHRVAIATRLRRLGLDSSWFETFARYWVDMLGGRPLWGVEDFYFLRGWHRVRHQANIVPDTNDPVEHLEAWQRPELLYQLFHQVYVESRFVNSIGLELLRRHRVKSLLEFGSATAPVTTHAVTFLNPGLHATIADLETIAFHYGAYKLRHYENIRPLLLRPETAFAPELDGDIDAVCCLTVFEHLNRPLEIAKAFHERLPRGGLLLFDYALSRGEGLDTRQGATERDAVLDFIEEHFEIVHGSVRRDLAVSLTAARKR